MRWLAAVTALIAGATVAMAVAAPPARGAEQLLEVIDVPASGARVQSATVLRSGATYRIAVNSTVEISYPGGRKEQMDALHCFGASGGTPFPGDDCLETPPPKISVLRFDIGGVTQGTLVALDGRVPDYNPAHEYIATFTPSAGGALGATVGPFLNGTGAGKFIINLYGEPAPSAPGRPAAEVPPGSVVGQPPIVGPPLFRILDIGFSARADSFLVSKGDPVRSLHRPRIGFVLGEGDEITVVGGTLAPATITLQALPSGAIFTISGNSSYGGHFAASATPNLMTGELTITTAGSAREQQRLPTGGPAVVLTPVARVDASGGQVRVSHDPARRRTTVGSVRGAVSVAAANPALRGLRLTPGQQVQVTGGAVGPPLPLVPDLETTIPNPRQVRAGPAIVVGPATLSLRSLRRSKCVATIVQSGRPARVLVTIFSGKRSIRLFGQRLLVFIAAGRRTTCIRVPARARTFDVRTPLSFAVGYALGARARVGERPTKPVIRPVRLVP